MLCCSLYGDVWCRITCLDLAQCGAVLCCVVRCTVMCNVYYEGKGIIVLRLLL